ncbi:MAG: hypothetical protein J7513_01765 [Solirubrobacteraceae bacterium]|nr:hypothetical protein [Solirubrobacteraceae bacterium]
MGTLLVWMIISALIGRTIRAVKLDRNALCSISRSVAAETNAVTASI